MTHDLIVIGAGPAGIAAACTAADHGLRTVLLDEQPQAGGQIYRNVASASASLRTLLGPDYVAGATCVERLRASAVDYRPGSLVWDVGKDLTVAALQEGRPVRLKAPQVIAATGALERASPVPGWTLPGVLNAGAAQLAIKSGGFVPTGRVVLAGAGPLLLLVACQLLAAGVNVEAMVETAPAANLWQALPHLPRALRASEYLVKGSLLLLQLRRAGLRRYRHATGLRVLGSDRCRALQFAHGAKVREIPADVVLLHHGVITNVQLSRLLDVDHDWDDAQQGWRIVCDAFGQTSLPGFRCAGDAVSVAGALAARATGTLAALGAAHAVGSIAAGDLARLAEPHRRELARQLSVRPFLDALYRPPRFITDPSDESIVCRCEEVTAGTVREMARTGCAGPNQAKFSSRCGMGPCQGRVCGVAVTQIIAQAGGRPEREVGAYRVRAPLKPIALSSLADLADEFEHPPTSTKEPR